MTEAVLLAGAFLVGAAITQPLRPTAALLTRLALALPVGVGAYLLVGWALLVARVPFSPLAVVALVAVVGAAGGAAATVRYGRPSAVEVGAVALGVVAVAGASLVLQAVPMARLTPDSVRFLVGSGVLVASGGLADMNTYDLVHRHVVEALLHTPAALTPLDYVPSITPLFGLAGIAATVTLADEGLRRTTAPVAVRMLVGAAAALFLLTTNRAVYNLFYVHGHMLVAVGMVVAVAAAWLAITTQRDVWAVLAAGALVLVVVARAEGFLLAVLVVVPAVASGRLSTRQTWVVVGATAVAIAAWFGAVVRPLAGGGLTHADGALAVAVLLIAFAALRGAEPLRVVYRYSPHALVGGVAAALAVAAVVDPQTLTASVEAMWENVTDAGGWRLTWIGLPVLLGLAAVSARLPHAAVWWTPIVGFVPLLLLLAHLRGHAYRVGTGDSGSRMLMHLLLVAVAYLIVAAWHPRRAAAPEDLRARVAQALRALERRTARVLRSPAARWAGLVVGVVALGFLAWSLYRAGDEAVAVLRRHDAAALATMLAAFAVLQATSLLSLHAIGGRPASRIWAAAQLIKYLPVPGSAGVGMVGSTVRHGHSPRAALGFLIRHSLLLVGAATAVSALVVTTTPAGALPGWVPTGTVVGAGLVVVGLAVAGASVATYPSPGRWVAVGVAVVGWAVTAVLLGVGFAAEGAGALFVGGVFVAGWVAGQIAVPVPAGIGVREAAIVWLAGPAIGFEAAVAFALVTRLLHVAIDGALIAGVGVIDRRAGASRDRTAG